MKTGQMPSCQASFIARLWSLLTITDLVWLLIDHFTCCCCWSCLWSDLLGWLPPGACTDLGHLGWGEESLLSLGHGWHKVATTTWLEHLTHGLLTLRNKANQVWNTGHYPTLLKLFSIYISIPSWSDLLSFEKHHWESSEENTSHQNHMILVYFFSYENAQISSVWTLHTCILILASLCMYCEARWALRSSLRWASATYRGLDTRIRPFISVTALVASSGELKHTKPKPLDLPSSPCCNKEQKHW